MEKENLITVRIRRSDAKILESLKDHPRQAVYEVVSEVVSIATEGKRGSK